ncbi:MAG: efflux RND transporter periplasmic adaptor subunit [Candidatus Rokubacteria bacterium]|nr:efflux RND transporter periplasmic adaptor subunit [Candidatus Rokubacteria bacterium]
MKRLGLVLLLLLVAAGLATAGYVLTGGRGQAAKYRTARVDRGTIVASVSATGNVNAVTTVLVGSQVSGQIKEIRVDFNSPVEKGQLIARLDPEIFAARVNAARADVESAQAAVLNQQANVEKVRADVENGRAATVTAEANVERMRADVENARAVITTAQANVARESATVANARRELDRRVDLLRRELVSQSEKDQAQTAFDTTQAQLEAARSQERAGQAALRSTQAQLAAGQSQAKASLAQLTSVQAALRVAEAQLKAAEANVRQKQAALEQARVDLEHTEIRAPVNGVVVSRNVDVGQTVAASLQAPTLFTIAQDLTRMQVEAAVDEADIGRLREGMPATFTVDAFPGRTFRGQIVQIRKAPQIVQNVVTYTTVIAVSNPERILMPGMTANVRIQVDRKDDVLRVPSAALRFRPPGETAGPTGGPAAPSAAGGSGGSPAVGAGPGSAGGGGSLGQVRETLTKELGLKPEQQEPLDGILAESRQAFAGLRAQGLDDKAREAQRKRIRADTRERIRALLSPEQQKKYDALVAAQEGAGDAGSGAPAGSPARVFVVGPDGKPKAVPIVIGVSDGSYAELLRGELQPGQELLTGQTGPAPQRAGGSPRLRI